MLDNVVIQMDTREKAGKKGHITSAFDAAGVRYIRSKMYVGDYTLLHDQSLCIDVKQGLQEVYSNLVQEHERFRAECVRARDAGIRLLILVEQPEIQTLEDVHTWENPSIAAYNKKVLEGAERPKRPPISSLRLQSMMLAMTALYDVEWRFCAPKDTGKVIINILTGGKGNEQ